MEWNSSQASNFYSPSIGSSQNNHLTNRGEKLIGYYSSRGIANNRPVFCGPCNGVYYYTESFNKISLDERQKTLIKYL